MTFLVRINLQAVQIQPHLKVSQNGLNHELSSYHPVSFLSSCDLSWITRPKLKVSVSLHVNARLLCPVSQFQSSIFQWQREKTSKRLETRAEKHAIDPLVDTRKLADVRRLPSLFVQT
jgi:hypothetical protein